jgi:hypothetical protein
MKRYTRIAAVIAGCLLVAAPAMALATPGNGKGNGPGVEYAPVPPKTPGPAAGLPEKAKAYGRYCQGQSKKHVDGQKGTPFSQCVTAMAKAAHDEKLTARQACKGLSKKHVKGLKGTPFSRCVTGVAKLRG